MPIIKSSYLVQLGRYYTRAVACGALANYRDAYNDLLRWPEHHQMILEDLKQAIEAHETKEDEK